MLVTHLWKCAMLGPGLETMPLKWCGGKWCSSSVPTPEQVLCHWPQWQEIKVNPIKGGKPSVFVSSAGTWKLFPVWKEWGALGKIDVLVQMTVFAPLERMHLFYMWGTDYEASPLGYVSSFTAFPWQENRLGWGPLEYAEINQNTETIFQPQKTGRPYIS